ncbi:hypothetical protein [Humibacillus xanthopallidus]|uniref:N-acetyltransferase domain-containing protein n=1 Tax=Humibacillus xanthopallidus TaxID=412689 RepID=A0A543I0X7_9MICO|nr:hypothetical protein [Humibacillus xanthopallidus]TQM64238.1 hypothetical protein FBY41_0601 [Humibacillus xanthopallidus]
MPWTTTREVDRFLDRAAHFLAEDVVANNALLTEAHFWSRLPGGTDDACFGWWEKDDVVAAAFVLLPDHPVLCSPLHRSAASGLPAAVPGTDLVGVDATDVGAVTEAFATRGRTFRPRSRLSLLRLGQTGIRAHPRPEGHHRLADVDDLPLLRTWFAAFHEQHPEDRSHVAFVIDQPLDDRGLLVWEVGGQPVAMASRTPKIAGMVRMGLAFQPSQGTRYADAAFDVACAEAARGAETVLVLSGSPEATDTYTALGFDCVMERVVLQEA